MPEHFSGVAADEADQYLLALIAWEMLTGDMPTTVANAEQVLEGASPRFRDLSPLEPRVPGCPRNVSDVLQRMGCVDPKQRYGSLR